MKRTISFVAIVALVSRLTSFVLAALPGGSERDLNRRIVLGLGVLLVCASQTAVAEPARSYDYTLEYALSPADTPQVQRQ